MAPWRAKVGARYALRVPEGRRDENGDLIHDVIVMADALLAEVDALEWRLPGKTLIVEPKDPLEEMSRFRIEG